MSTRLHIASLAMGCLLLFVNAAHADNSWLDSFEQRYILESELAYDLHHSRTQKSDIGLRADLNVDLGELGRVSAIGRLRFDPTDRLEPGAPDASQEVRSGPTRRTLLGSDGDVELRELFVDKFYGEVFVRLGKQQIVWGEADGIRVLDTLNPVHFREFILPESEDRRIPLWMGQAEFPVGSSSLQFVWIPDHTYDDVSLPDSPFAFTSPLFVPQLPEGQRLNRPVTIDAPDRPRRFIKDDDFGVRLTTFKAGWDLSLNYLYHYSDQAILYRSATPEGIRFSPAYERTHLVGGTFSRAFSSFTLRGEIGYSTEKYYLSSDRSALSGVFRSPELSYVVGVDYQHDADLFVSGQIYQSVLTELVDGAVRDEVDTTVSLRVNKEYLNDTVKLTALALYNIDQSDGLIQLGLDYQWRSNINLIAGFDSFFGDRGGLYGQFGDADRVRLGFELEF